MDNLLGPSQRNPSENLDEGAEKRKSKLLLRLRPILLTLLGLYFFIYPWSLLFLAFDCIPAWGTWMGGALLILQGTLLGFWLLANHGPRMIPASLLILSLSWAAEQIGTTTGLPFGKYTYTAVLLPKIFDIVPLPIPFAWLLVVPATLATAEYLWFSQTSPSLVSCFQKALGAAFLALLLDTTIEPVAFHISKYWIWHETGFYYGVPLKNFLSWGGLSFLLTLILLFFLKNRSTQVSTTTFSSSKAFPWLPMLLYFLNLVLFTLVNLTQQQFIAAAVGLISLSFLLFWWLRVYLSPQKLVVGPKT